MSVDASSPEVSVIMGVFNGEAYIEEAILSILNQNFSNFELIVVDNASTDATVQKIHTITDPRIHLICNERNMERAYSRNIAVQQSTAPLIAVMDADDYAVPQRLEAQTTFMRKHLRSLFAQGSWKFMKPEKWSPFPSIMMKFVCSYCVTPAYRIQHGWFAGK